MFRYASMIVITLMACNGADKQDSAPGDSVDSADSGSECVCLPETCPVWYYDGDSDMYGLPEILGSVRACEPPSSYYVAATGDCDDSDPSIHPNAADTPNDGVDSDCDGSD